MRVKIGMCPSYAISISRAHTQSMSVHPAIIDMYNRTNRSSTELSLSACNLSIAVHRSANGKVSRGARDSSVTRDTTYYSDYSRVCCLHERHDFNGFLSYFSSFYQKRSVVGQFVKTLSFLIYKGNKGDTITVFVDVIIPVAFLLYVV